MTPEAQAQLVREYVLEADERLLKQVRSTPALIAIVLINVFLTAIGSRMHWADTVPEPFVLVASTAFGVAWTAAYIAYRAGGPRSLLYTVVDNVAASVFSAGNLMYIVFLPSPHNFGWLMHLLFVLHSGQSPKRRAVYSACYIGVPAVAVLVHTLQGHWGMALTASVYGALVWFMQRTLQRSAQQTAENHARTTTLEAEVRTLQLRAERARIARDLHDGVSAELHALIWLIEQKDGSVQLGSRLRATADELRDVVWGLSAAEKPWSEWLTDIRVRCRELCGDAMKLDFSYQENATGAISAQTQHALTRILLEATRNAVRHSGGQTLRIRLIRNAQDLSLDVSDDGRGFLDRRVLDSPRGLSNLRHRAQELGGLCEIDSSGAGAVVRVNLPVMRPDSLS
jgi:signal transduction histidine kinase